MSTPPDAPPPRPATTPRVAVVVPAYNAERYLAETLESVLSQTYRAWECIVVDDGSTDGTAAVARAFVERDARFRCVSQVNGGVSRARNTALDLVSADVTMLAFLDSDDLWLADALAVLVAALETEPDVAGVYGVADYIDADGRPWRTGAHAAVQADRRRVGRIDLVDVSPREPSTFETLIVSGTIWPPATALHRRSAVEQAGRFDAEQPYVEDWDLYLRMSRRADLVPLGRQVALYRQHPANITRHDEQMAYYHARLRWKAWQSAENTPAQYRQSQRTWRRLQLRWIYWSVQATVRAIRAGDGERARDAAGAATRFTRHLALGHPPEPDVRTAQLVSRFVAPRWAGRGSPDDDTAPVGRGR